MTLVSGNWAAVLEALKARVEFEVSSGVPDPDDESGGLGGICEVDVRIGDEELGVMQHQARGRVVLCFAGASGNSALTSRSNVEAIGGTLADFEAHMWVPTARVAKVGRTRLVSKLATCVARAIHHEHGGARGAAKLQGPFDRFDPAREPELLRNGQAGVMTFAVPTPITKGRYWQALEGDSRFASPSDDPGGDTNIIVNEEP